MFSIRSLRKHLGGSWNNSRRWITYDWANSVFATSAASAFFPIMLRNYWGKGLSSEDITLYLGLASSFTSFILVLTLPVLGHAVDQKIKNSPKALFLTAVLGGCFTASLFLLNEDSYHLALLLYVFAFIFFAFGNTQYDGMLLKICHNEPQEKLNTLSSKGYLYGYLGGGVLLLVQSLILSFHQELGFESSLLPAKLCFLSAGVWWIGFSIPLLGIKNLPAMPLRNNFGFIQNVSGFVKSLNRQTLFFLGAFFLYIDVVFTMYKMAVDFGLSMGLSQSHLILILIYVQIIGAPGTLLMNKISQKFNLKTALFVGILCYALVVGFSPFVTNIWSFAFLASFIGLAQGGLQALSRSHFVTLIEESKQGLGFGFLNVFGKVSAILGPLVVGLSAKALGENTYSVLTLMPFLILSLVFLYLSFKE